MRAVPSSEGAGVWGCRGRCGCGVAVVVLPVAEVRGALAPSVEAP